MTKWTEAEDTFLKANYGKLSASQCATGLNTNRTRSMIIGRADRLGLVSNLQSSGRPRSSKRRPEPSIAAGRKGPVSSSKIALATTSVNERMGGAGQFKEVVIREVMIDVPGYQCQVVPDIIALDAVQCRWPLDAGGFCGNDKYRSLNHKDTSYCLTHMKSSISNHHYRGGYWSTRK